MANIYYINDGSDSNTGLCSSMREAVAARASLVRTCGAEYRGTEIEVHDVKRCTRRILENAAKGPTPQVRRVAERELARREALTA